MMGQIIVHFPLTPVHCQMIGRVQVLLDPLHIHRVPIGRPQTASSKVSSTAPTAGAPPPPTPS